MSRGRLAFCSFAFLFLIGLALSVSAQSLPEGMSMTVTKKGDEKAVIKIVQGDKTWEAQEGQWGNLPEEARAYVRKMFIRPTPFKVEIDCSDSPESEEWAKKAAETAKEWFPILQEMLYSDDYRPVTSVKLVFKKMDGVAYASGNTITISAAWIERSPGDLGMVVHELTHVVQGFRGRNPGWLVEGMTDYIRFFIYEPGNVATRVNPDRNKYTDSYRVTGCFFDWIVRTQEKDFLSKMNAVCRAGKYNDNTFKDITGKTVDELWDMYAEALRKGDEPPQSNPERRLPRNRPQPPQESAVEKTATE